MKTYVKMFALLQETVVISQHRSDVHI